MSSEIIFDPVKHEYRDARKVVIPSVTQILAGCGLCDFSFVEEELRARSMQRGTSVHWMLQLEDEGKLNYRKVPMGLRPYRKAYLDWKRFSGFQPYDIERQFISFYGYAGTIDRTGKLPPTSNYPCGSVAIVDFKTGDVSDWVRYQLAAYVCGRHHKRGVVYRRIALALRADATYRVKEFPPNTLEQDFSIFMEGKRRTDAGHVDHKRAGD